MIIVAGRIYTYPGSREQFLENSRSSISAARATEGCYDFVVAPDPLEEDRVNIYEAWVDSGALQRFRGTGPDSDITNLISRAEVKEYVVESSTT
ncbi:MAG: antibiotic biosynthesis monooxygenase [Pseudomonadales bacterium]